MTPSLRPVPAVLSRMRGAAGRWIGVLGVGTAALFAPGSVVAQDSDGLYEQGVALEDEGKWREALEVWASIADSLVGTGQSDPRAGVAFMATAVDRGAEDRLEEGSALYLWGFSGSNWNEEHLEQAVEDEVRRIMPLLAERDSARWEALLGEEPTVAAARRVARFWLEHDPTPETSLNERLVEHWGRIIEARRRYRYNVSSVYETDDRGVVFVKYGPPDTKANGSLGTNEMELKIRVADAKDREVMRRYDTNPQFELWKYGGLNPEDFTYYLFGNVDGTGPFELVDGPVDLINPSARSLASSSSNPGGVRMQHYLELFYYRDLAILGGRFGARFDELASLWDGYTMRRNAYGAASRPAPTGPTLETFSFRYEQEDRYFPPGEPTIPVRSEFEGASRGVEMVVQPIRILDRSEQPMLVVQALSAPRVRYGDEERRTEYANPLRDTDHTLVLRDEALEEAGRLTQLAPADLGGISVFHLRHPPLPIHLTVYGEALGQPMSEADTLSLAGQAHAYVQAPLSSDPAVFEVSDLAVGTPVLDGDVLDETLPFPLLPGSRIWTGDALRVYLELYHLAPDGQGRGQYALEFRLLPVDEVGEVRSTPDPVTLGIQLESDDDRAQRSFDIGLAGLELGFYRLEVDATDRVSGATKRRVTEIEIIS